MTSILVLPDAHSTPEENNSRFTLAGKFILDHKPEAVVCLGDFADMASLSSYDRGKKSFEGRRVINDIAAAEDANLKLWAPVNEYNLMRKKNRDRQYKPLKVMLLGNHEDRISRAVECDAELDGLISVDNLGYANHGWEVIPYKRPYFLDNIAFCHHFPTGISGMPISGSSIARTLLQKNYQSSVVGHNHLRDFHTDTRADGRKLCGLSAGWFGDFVPSFADNSAKLWWAGLTMLHDVNDGAFEPSFHSMDMLRKQYG
jgi:hypothetical protein